MKMMFNHVGQQFEVLSRRERVLIGIALLALVSIIGFMPLESLWKKQTSISQQLKVWSRKIRFRFSRLSYISSV